MKKDDDDGIRIGTPSIGERVRERVDNKANCKGLNEDLQFDSLTE